MHSKQDVNNERLETPKQRAQRVGISERQVRHLVQTRQLEHVIIGSRVHIPADAWPQFIAAKRVRSCPDETKDQDCVGLRSETAFTSFGLNARRLAEALRRRELQ
jgi:hypothetical protein